MSSLQGFLYSKTDYPGFGLDRFPITTYWHCKSLYSTYVAKQYPPFRQAVSKVSLSVHGSRWFSGDDDVVPFAVKGDNVVVGGFGLVGVLPQPSKKKKRHNLFFS